MAKTKRINRNFYDVVAKAKWMQDLKDNNLVDDTGTAAPEIIEIPLRDLCTNIDLDALRKQNDPIDADDDWPSSWQDDWLLPDREEMVPLNAANNSSHEEICETNCSRLLESSQNRTANSPDKNSTEDNQDIEKDCHESKNLEESALIATSTEECQLIDINDPPTTTRQMAVVPFRRRSNPPRVRFADNCPLSCSDLTSIAGEIPNNVDDGGKYSKRKSSWCEDRNNILVPVGSKDTSVLPMKNNKFKSLICKRPSLQDQMLPSMQTGFCVESITKEELLVMWKTSEIELTGRLEKALKEKAKLEQKLADLELGSPV